MLEAEFAVVYNGQDLTRHRSIILGFNQWIDVGFDYPQHH